MSNNNEFLKTNIWTPLVETALKVFSSSHSLTHGPHLETKGRNTLCGQNPGGIIPVKAEKRQEPEEQTTGSVETQNLHASSVTAALIHWYLCMVMRSKD